MAEPYELPLYYLDCPHTLSLCSVPSVTSITLTGVCRPEDDDRDAHSKILSLLKTLPYPGRCFPKRSALELGSGAPCCQDPAPACREPICLPLWTPLGTKSQQGGVWSNPGRCLTSVPLPSQTNGIRTQDSPCCEKNCLRTVQSQAPFLLTHPKTWTSFLAPPSRDQLSPQLSGIFPSRKTNLQLVRSQIPK